MSHSVDQASKLKSCGIFIRMPLSPIKFNFLQQKLSGFCTKIYWHNENAARVLDENPIFLYSLKGLLHRNLAK